MSEDLLLTNKVTFYEMPIDLFCVIDLASHQITQANRSFETILGWKSEELIGHTLDTFLDSETDKSNLEKAFAKIASGVRSILFETEFRTKNNVTRFIDWKCYVDDENHVFAIGRDITQYKAMQKTLENQAQIDPITGVWGRQAFLTLLRNELRAAFRFHFPTAVILVDVDHFKNYNEHYGIEKGDECLKQIAIALKTLLRRKTDFLARFENDTFAILLSHNDLEKAVKAAEYLRTTLEKLALRPNEMTRHPISISLGVCAIPSSPEKEITVEQMLSNALRALRTSQSRGGNRVSHVEDFK